MNGWCITNTIMMSVVDSDGIRKGKSREAHHQTIVSIIYFLLNLLSLAHLCRKHSK
jgi:hypothetical protein